MAAGRRGHVPAQDRGLEKHSRRSARPSESALASRRRPIAAPGDCLRRAGEAGPVSRRYRDMPPEQVLAIARERSFAGTPAEIASRCGPIRAGVDLSGCSTSCSRRHALRAPDERGRAADRLRGLTVPLLTRLPVAPLDCATWVRASRRSLATLGVLFTRAPPGRGPRGRDHDKERPSPQCRTWWRRGTGRPQKLPLNNRCGKRRLFRVGAAGSNRSRALRPASRRCSGVRLESRRGTTRRPLVRPAASRRVHRSSWRPVKRNWNPAPPQD